MAVIPIIIEKRPNGNIAPRPDNSRTTGIVTKVKTGDEILYGVKSGTAGLSILFEGQSPLGDSEEDHNPTYGTAFAIAKAFVPGQTQANRYKYRCTVLIDGVEHSSSNNVDDGGEIEIGPEG
jgi:hypothetical protein